MQCSWVRFVVALGLFSLMACTPLPKSFTPRTPDEQAVVRTIDAFLAAWSARDAAALGMLVSPEATLQAFVDGSLGPATRILDMVQTADHAPILRASARNLVDFHAPTPESASVSTYDIDFIQNDWGTEQVTSRLQWDLRRSAGQWRIQRMRQTTWITPFYLRGIGPS